LSAAAFEIVPYEPGRRGDFLALMREVYEGSGWSEEEFDWWFEQNPTGRFILNLADADGQTIGAAAQSYARMILDGREAEATFTIHVMTGAAARGKGVFSALQLHNDEQAARSGARLALGFTNPMAGPIFVGKLGWDELCWLRLWARPKRPLRAIRHLRAHGQPAGCVRGSVEEFGPRHEEIYRRAAAGWADHFVKDAPYLNWRYGATPRRYASFSTARGFAVVGWGVFRGVSAGLVCELVGGDGVRLLNRCVRAVDADVVIAMPNRGEHGTYLAAGFVPTPSAIRFIGRSLQPDEPLPHGRDAFRFSLGDTDIF
jgi:GNAT superfamily N-acetyltransferase